ncbi:MAG: AsmA family protein [Betaproteobacteria bacterium]
MFGTEFSGDVVTGAQLRFLETGESFPLRGHVSAVDSRLDFDGSVADLFKPSAMNAKVRLAGPSLSRFNAFGKTSLPASRRYEVAAQVRQRGRATDIDNLKGKIGTSDFAGSLRVDLSKARPMLTASLRGGSMDWSDLSSLGDSAGPGTAAHKAKGSAGEAGTAGGKPGQNGAVRDGVQRDRPDDVAQGERLAAFDAHVSVDVEKLSTTSLPGLGPVRGTAQLEDGILVVKPIDVGLAGGHITGSLTVDGRKSPLAAHATMAFREVRLERLLARLPKQPQGAGPLEGSVDMKATGATVAALLAHSSGTMEASMEGGVISNMLDAKLGLNGGKILRLLITGDRAIGIRRAVVAFDFEKGIGRSRTILLDTDQTRTEGEGVIDLTDQTLDVLLTPHRKKPGIFALRSSIRIQGPIRQPAFSLEKKAKAKAESADADTR